VHTVELPLADGGEGTLAAILATRPGRVVTCEALDAYGRTKTARFVVWDDGTALVEAAEGPGWVPPERRPRPAREADSRGLGQMIKAALAAGAERLLITLGGTGSSDGGLGLVRELGGEVTASGTGVAALESARLHTLSPLPVPARVWSDVEGPLSGPAGAIYGFGPQKGLLAEDLEHWERAMGAWGIQLDRLAGRPVSALRGAGAAGGLGAALAALGAALEPGGEAVAALLGLDDAIQAADVVVTGEGQVDGQSLQGKVVGTVLTHARRHGRPVIVAAPSLGPGSEALSRAGALLYPMLPGPVALADAMAQAAEYAEEAGARMYYWIEQLDISANRGGTS
jgi:glycerate kinase